MDRGKKQGRAKPLNKPNSTIYMGLQYIIREHALRYLPAKSLYSCSAVCRDWKVQASNPFFAHSQSYFFSSLSGLFCQTSDGSLSFISVDPMAFGVPDPELEFLPEPVDLLASSNGLLCCRGRNEDKAYYVCNPVNQQWKKLPRPEAEHGLSPTVVVAFEPSLLKFVAEFKIVCAFPSADITGAYEFEIYSSIEDSWKISSEICFGEEVLKFEHGGVHVNGVVYWIANTYSVTGFDLKKNRSFMIKSPEYTPLDSTTLGVAEGKLCASLRIGADVRVWELSNVYANTQSSPGTNTWVERKIVSKQANSSIRYGRNDHVRSVLAAGSDLIVFHNGGTIFAYNKKTKETKTLSTDAYRESSLYVPYVNSLVSL